MLFLAPGSRNCLLPAPPFLPECFFSDSNTQLFVYSMHTRRIHGYVYLQFLNQMFCTVHDDVVIHTSLNPLGWRRKEKRHQTQINGPQSSQIGIAQVGTAPCYGIFRACLANRLLPFANDSAAHQNVKLPILYHARIYCKAGFRVCTTISIGGASVRRLQYTSSPSPSLFPHIVAS